MACTRTTAKNSPSNKAIRTTNQSSQNHSLFNDGTPTSKRYNNTDDISESLFDQRLAIPMVMMMMTTTVWHFLTSQRLMLKKTMIPSSPLLLQKPTMSLISSLSQLLTKLTLLSSQPRKTY
jgi:hypothetical protein